MNVHHGIVHCIGIGGIHVSAIAKLLVSRGWRVSGSDLSESEGLRSLQSQGVNICIGHRSENIPHDTNVVVYSHAVPEDNPELIEARRRGIDCVDTHAFLGLLFEGKRQIVVTGTHGKSTTTSMLGVLLMAAELNPTIVVGTNVSRFEQGNLQVGSEELLVVEGDEYRRHVLSYEPSVLVLNNIEYDHPDAFPDMEAYVGMFRELIELVRDEGIIIYNADDEQCTALIRSKIQGISERGIRLLPVGKENGAIRFSEPRVEAGSWVSTIRALDSQEVPIRIQQPGEINIRNAAMAFTAAVAEYDTVDPNVLTHALATFPGCWRRFERIGCFNGAAVFSDYGHHPTEVRETIKAARASFPSQRIVLCFQPHHRNRTKGLFHEFTQSFDGVDVLLMPDIYDVPGRESEADANVSSEQLIQEIRARNEGVRNQVVEYTGDLSTTEERLRALVTKGDILLLMGAGSIDKMGRRIVHEQKEI